MSSSKTISEATPSVFDNLKGYIHRVLIVRGNESAKEFIASITRFYELTNPEIQSEVFAANDEEVELDYVQLTPGGRRLYFIYAPVPVACAKASKNLFKLVKDSATTPIVYIHSSAAPIFNATKLYNFPSVIFHDDAEEETYLKYGIVGNDQQEIVYGLLQKQNYLRTSIKSAKDFRAEKDERKKTIKPRHKDSERSRSRSRSPKPRREKKERSEQKPTKRKGGKTEEKIDWTVEEDSSNNRHRTKAHEKPKQPIKAASKTKQKSTKSVTLELDANQEAALRKLLGEA